MSDLAKIIQFSPPGATTHPTAQPCEKETFAMPKDTTDQQNVTPFAIAEGPMTITAKQASFIRTGLRFEGQRDETKAMGHVNRLAEDMKRGNWHTKDPIAFARLPDGTLILVNGYHRMLAQASCGLSIMYVVIIHDCIDMDAVRMLYTKFDGGRVRSTANKASALGVAEKIGISDQSATAIMRAAQVINDDMRVAAKTPKLQDEDILAVVSDYAPEARMLEECMKKGGHRVASKIRNAGAYSMALVTMRANPEAAMRFWSGLCENDGLRKGDPRSTLLQFFLTYSAKGSLNAYPVAICLAWNAFVEGRTLAFLRISGAGAKRIAGTNYRVQV